MKVIKKKQKPAPVVSKQFKSAGVPPIEPTIRKGAWQIARESGAKVQGMPKLKRKSAAIALDEDSLLEMAREKAGGATNNQLAVRYGVGESYISEALKKLYISNSQGKEILKGIMLENAIGTSMQAGKKMSELTPMQSVMASSILTRTYIDLDKHTMNQPSEVDLTEIDKVGRLINELDEQVKAAGLKEQVGEIIDVSAQVERAK